MDAATMGPVSQIWKPEPNDENLDALISVINGARGDELSTECARVHGVGITNAIFQSLRPGVWFYGEIIEAYLRILTDADTRFDVLSPYFYKTLVRCGIPETLKLYSKEILKFSQNSELKAILIPVHLDVHWTLCVFFNAAKVVHYWDRAKGENWDVVLGIQDFFSAAGMADKYVTPVFRTRDPMVSGQKDNHSCGPFCCSYARCVVMEREVDFKEADMSEIRRSIGYALLRNTSPVVPLQDVDEDDDLEVVFVSTVAKDQPKVSVQEEPKVSIQDVITETATDLLDELTVGDDELNKARVTQLMHYAPSYKTLAELRLTTEPFVDINKENREFTANAGDDWRKFLKLREVLSVLADTEEEAWLILASKLQEEPQVALTWAWKVSSPGQPATPQSFRFGSPKNFRKVKKIIETAFPAVKMIDSHADYYKAQKKKKAKEARLKPY